MNISIYTLSQYASGELKDTYEPEEIRSICRLIFMDVFHYTNIDIHIQKHENLPESFLGKFQEIIARLKQGEPIQYIIGTTEFAGLTFTVNPSTLIPRPETEELVLWIKSLAAPSSHILDIGTGSGCIAITLAHLLPDSRVTGIDISADALATASHNAMINLTKVQFRQADIFDYRPESGSRFDIIVSNPPYVRMSEKQYMQRQVVDFEPPTALFVPDKDPLLFYWQIAKFGQTHLRKNGLLFFEINEALGQDTVDLLARYPYSGIEIKKDFLGKDRFIKCTY